jgi:hypothetical protein
MMQATSSGSQSTLHPSSAPIKYCDMYTKMNVQLEVLFIVRRHSMAAMEGMRVNFKVYTQKVTRYCALYLGITLLNV